MCVVVTDWEIIEDLCFYLNKFKYLLVLVLTELCEKM
jgi:hypothetical protein